MTACSTRFPGECQRCMSGTCADSGSYDPDQVFEQLDHEEDLGLNVPSVARRQAALAAKAAQYQV